MKAYVGKNEKIQQIIFKLDIISGVSYEIK